MDNLYNQTNTYEQAQEQTIETNVEQVKEVKFPTKTEIERAFKEVKVSSSYTSKDIQNLSIGLSFLEPALQAADETAKTLIAKNIEMIIENSYSAFLRDFRQFRKTEKSVSQSFISDFLLHCEMKLEEVLESVKSDNSERQKQVIEQTREAFDRAELSKEDLILVRQILSMSTTKKAALITELTASK